MHCKTKDILYPIGYLSAMGTAVVVVRSHPHIPFPLCPFKLLTGLPCPGCGGIRAAEALLQGDVLNALYINPLSCILILFCIVLPFIYLYDKIRKKTTLETLLVHPWNRKTTAIVCLIILLNWIWNIYKDL